MPANQEEVRYQTQDLPHAVWTAISSPSDGLRESDAGRRSHEEFSGWRGVGHVRPGDTAVPSSLREHPIGGYAVNLNLVRPSNRLSPRTPG